MKWTEEAKAYCPKGLAGNPPFVAWMARHLGDGLLVDCGASVGAVCVATLLAAGPGARAVAFEPQMRSADVLVELVKANKVDVKLYRKAVADEIGQALLKYPVDRSISGWATIADTPDFFEAKAKQVQSMSEWVDVTTLDTWWEEAGKPDVQVVKIDTQGAEPNVLKGGAEMFTATAPYLFIEKHAPTLAEHGYLIADLIEAIESFGYEWEPANKNNLRCWKKGLA